MGLRDYVRHIHFLFDRPGPSSLATGQGKWGASAASFVATKNEEGGCESTTGWWFQNVFKYVVVVL